MPPPQAVLAAVRAAREGGQLRTAIRALDHLYGHLDEHDDELRGLAAAEGELLGRELAVRGASLAALGEWLRAEDLGRDQRENLRRLVRNYSSWRPEPQPIGVRGDQLKAGAGGEFWVNCASRGRIVTLEGGITGEGTEAFTRVLELSAQGVDYLFVDMAKLSYVGSTGLAVAVKTAERLRTCGGALSLFSLSSNLKLLVETLGLAAILHPVEGLEGALAFARRQ